MSKRTKVNAEEIQLPNNFHTYIKETIKGTFKKSIVEGLPVYIKESVQFIDYIEQTIKEVSAALIRDIVAEKLGLAKAGNTYRLHNDAKHPLAKMINSLFQEEVEDIVKSVGKDLVASTIAGIKSSIQNDGEFVANVKESITGTIQEMVVAQIKEEIFANSKQTIADALKEMDSKF
jgi:hypothetical protein